MSARRIDTSRPMSEGWFKISQQPTSKCYIQHKKNIFAGIWRVNSLGRILWIEYQIAINWADVWQVKVQKRNEKCLWWKFDMFPFQYIRYLGCSSDSEACHWKWRSLVTDLFKFNENRDILLQTKLLSPNICYLSRYYIWCI